jgi:RND family efflux transporter MFP subunit
MLRIKWVAVAIPVFLLVVSVIALIVKHELNFNPPAARIAGVPLPVSHVPVQQVENEQIIGANGSVSPINTIDMVQQASESVAGKVTSVLVDIGDIVEAGQKMMEFDQRKAVMAVEATQTGKKQAEAELEMAQSDLLLLNSLMDSGMEQTGLKKAESNVAYAKTNLELAEKNLQRLKSVREKKLIAEADVEKALLEVKKAKADYLAMLEENFQTKIEWNQQKNLARQKEVKAKTDALNAQQKLLNAQLDLENTTVNAPVAGVILDRHISLGEMATEGVKLFTFGQLDHVLVIANLPEEYLANVYIGQKASATFNAFPNDIFDGEVVKISPVTDVKTKAFEVHVKIPNSSLKLKPGLSSFVRLHVDNKALMVPNISLINPAGENTSVAFVADNNDTVKATRVKTGSSNHTMTEIVDGLAKGDKVVVVGQYYLKDGDTVRNVEK